MTEGVFVVRKIIAIILTFAVCACGFFVGVTTYADKDQDDQYGNAISFYLSDSEGDTVEGKTGPYAMGQDYFYFKVDVYATTLKNGSAVRKINFMDEDENYTNNVSDFEYFDGSAWVDATQKYRGTKTDTSPTEVVANTGSNVIRYRVKFNSNQKFLVEYSVVCSAKGVSLNSKKYIDIKNGTYTMSKEKNPPTSTQQITHSIYIDGKEEATVVDGGTYSLPTTSGYGYYEKLTEKMYRRGYEFDDITYDLSFDSVDQINIASTWGANIRCDGIHGIRFGDQLSVYSCEIDGTRRNLTEKLLKNGTFQMGTILTNYSNYVNYLEEDLSKQGVDANDPNCQYHYDVLNPSNDWPIDGTTHRPIYGRCYAGITHIKEYNIATDFMANAYVQAKYQNYDGSTYYNYFNGSNCSDTVRSIQQVATNMKNGGYQGTEQEMYWINWYYNWD